MSNRNKYFIAMACLLIVAWICSLGLYFIADVEAHCRSKDSNKSLKYELDEFLEGKSPYCVTVIMEPEFIYRGIPYLLSFDTDILPYNIELVVIVNNSYADKEFVLEEFSCLFDDGDKYAAPGLPQVECFLEHKFPIEKINSQRVSFVFPDAIRKRGSFDIKYKGHITGSEELIEGMLRMNYSRNIEVHSGWFMVKLAGL